MYIHNTRNTFSPAKDLQTRAGQCSKSSIKVITSSNAAAAITTKMHDYSILTPNAPSHSPLEHNPARVLVAYIHVVASVKYVGVPVKS